jgi:glutamate--cysteine ligase
MRFLDVFLLHCLLADSPPDSPEEIERIGRNQHRAAQQGRDPNVRLFRDQGEIALTAWAGELLDECEPIAAALDEANGTGVYGDALRHARAALLEPASTPSARVLERMARAYDNSFRSFALDQSLKHRRTLLDAAVEPALLARYAAMAERSLAEQAAMENVENESFEAFLQRYLSPQPAGIASV